MKVIKGLAVFTVLATMFSCGNQQADVKSLETEVDSVSYAIGMDMASKIKANFSEANTAMFLQGYRNGIDSTNLLIEQKDMTKTIQAYFQKLQAEKLDERQKKMMKEAEEKYGDNKRAGEAFLAANKTKEGVKTTASGLQYIVLKEGDKNGEVIKGDTRVRIHYHGMNIDGEVFDSTVKKGKPYESFANQFVTGFSEGLMMMKKGAKYKLFIPQELAYGPNPRSQQIRPFSALIFEVELLDILDK